MRQAIRALCLVLVAAGAAQAGPELPLAAEQWRPRPEWLGDPVRRAEDYSLTEADGCLRFEVNSPGREMIWTCSLPETIDTGALRFLMLRYRVQDYAMDSGHLYFLYLGGTQGGTGPGGHEQLKARDLVDNGQWQTHSLQLVNGTVLREVAVRVAADDRPACVELAGARFEDRLVASPLADSLHFTYGWPEDTGGFEPVVLTGRAGKREGHLREWKIAPDWFESPQVTASGVPFQVRTEGYCVWHVPQEGRDSLPLWGKGSELYLLMGAWLQPVRTTPRHKVGTLDRAISRDYRFWLTVEYGDGATDRLFPYCLDTDRYEVARGVKAYVVPLDPGRELRALGLHADMDTSRLVAAAVTVNRSTPRLGDLWQIREAPVAASTLEVPATEPRIERDPDGLTIHGSTWQARLDTQHGVALVTLQDRRLPHELRFVPSPVFTVSVGLEFLRSTDFTLEGEPRISADGRSVALKLQARREGIALGADLTLLAADDELRMELALRNEGDEPLSARMRFPDITGLAVGEVADTCYFSPERAMVVSDRRAPAGGLYGCEFPLQMMDIYHRAGGGVAVLNREERHVDRKWEIAKSSRGVAVAVEYRYFAPIAAGGSQEFPMVALQMHEGDWHEPFARYREWARGQFAPLRPRPQWWLDRFNFHTFFHHNSQWGIFDPDTKQWRLDQELPRRQAWHGPPEFAHFFDWRISPTGGMWGTYHDYDAVGGLQTFRGEVAKLQARGIKVGLYLEGFLASSMSQVARDHPEWRMVLPGGKFDTRYSKPDEPIYAMCPHVPGWQDWLAATVAKLVNDTGVDGIYLDEFGFNSSGYFCYNAEHGHPVPMPTMGAEAHIMAKVRAALPDDVVLYTEEAGTDAWAPTCDGAFGYAAGFTDPDRCPGHVPPLRFLYPDFKFFQINPSPRNWNGFKDRIYSVLFNGLGLNTSTYWQEPDVLDHQRRIMAILQAHAQTFGSAHAEPLVPTLVEGIYANRFPGASETIWTVWNSHWGTVRRPMLRVPHVAGATYEDLWRGAPLEPVVRDGTAELTLELDCRGIACVLQTRP